MISSARQQEQAGASTAAHCVLAVMLWLPDALPDASLKMDAIASSARQEERTGSSTAANRLQQQMLCQCCACYAPHFLSAAHSGRPAILERAKLNRDEVFTRSSISLLAPRTQIQGAQTFCPYLLQTGWLCSNRLCLPRLHPSSLDKLTSSATAVSSCVTIQVGYAEVCLSSLHPLSLILLTSSAVAASSRVAIHQSGWLR
jgi:hypothetical protein